MPQPMKPIVGQRFYTDTRVLETRPECAVKIAIVASIWAGIEEDLARWFGWLAGEPLIEKRSPFELLNRKQNEPFAAALTAIENLHLRIVVIRAAMETRASDMQREEFEKIAQELRARAGDRNIVVHTKWVATPRYPADVLRWKDGGWIRYTAKDFDEIIERLSATELKLMNLAADWAIQWAPKRPVEDPPPAS